MARKRHTGPRKGVRRRPPKIRKNKEQVLILCPYCWPEHTINPEAPANCGTLLELAAVQTTYSRVECALCGGSAGTLIKVGERYKHEYDCTPGKTIYTVPPSKSRLAALAWKAPPFVHRFIARRWGRAVVELSAEGDVTGYGWDVVRAVPIGVPTDG